ncbi:conserved oligomeric Golgi complex subunit 5-like [Sycon ciliatum]|uniref:conserved oligomeric Golgi complex subunit 5-like n=1 Tax=Sycon ciliatum TaxID=27933 RepID=UPI0031F5F2E6
MMEADGNEPSVLELVSSDERCHPFLEDEFDVQRYSNTIIESEQVAQTLQHIASSVALLDRDLNQQVVSHHEDLLSQATGIEKLEGVLHMVQTRIESLQAGVQRIRSKIAEPHSKIISRTTQLSRLQTVCELLRRLIRVLSLRKKLRAQLKGGVRELTKAAQSLSELDYLSQGVDLSGIEVLESDWAWVAQARNSVISHAETMLAQGLESQNSSSIGTALQVFQHLNILHRNVKSMLQSTLDQLQDAVRTLLNPSTLASSVSAIDSASRSAGSSRSSSLPSVGSSAAWRASLWTRLDRVMDKFYQACSQVFLLYKVLTKRRDSVSHISFIQELQKDGHCQLTQDFWSKATHILQQQLGESCADSSSMKQALEGEYPKLLRLIKALWARVLQLRSADAATIQPSTASPLFAMSFLDSDHASSVAEKQLRSSVSSFESAYLSRSLSQLLDPINLSFPVGSKQAPATQDLTSIIKTISNELNIANGDDTLVQRVARNVQKTLQCYMGKCQQLTSSWAQSVVHIAGAPTRQQLCCIGVANSLYALHRGVAEVLTNVANIDQDLLTEVYDELKELRSTEEEFIRNVVLVVKDTVEAILNSMHEEDWAGPAGNVGAQCSGYISELKNFIGRVADEHIRPFENKEFCKGQLTELSVRVLELFVRHVSLIRPLEESGRLQLAADIAQVEFAVAPFCARAADLGRPYRLLRAFRPLLIASVDEIGSSTALGDTLPYSLVLDFLFSYAPDELRSPHTVADWTQMEYSRWIDSHTEAEHLALIKATIESYVKSARSRGVRQFAPVYTTMVELLTAASTAAPTS